MPKHWPTESVKNRLICHGLIRKKNKWLPFVKQKRYLSGFGIKQQKLNLSHYFYLTCWLISFKMDGFNSITLNSVPIIQHFTTFLRSFNWLIRAILTSFPARYTIHVTMARKHSTRTTYPTCVRQLCEAIHAYSPNARSIYVSTVPWSLFSYPMWNWTTNFRRNKKPSLLSEHRARLQFVATWWIFTSTNDLILLFRNFVHNAWCALDRELLYSNIFVHVWRHHFRNRRLRPHDQVLARARWSVLPICTTRRLREFVMTSHANSFTLCTWCNILSQDSKHHIHICDSFGMHG